MIDKRVADLAAAGIPGFYTATAFGTACWACGRRIYTDIAIAAVVMKMVYRSANRAI